MDIDGRNRYIIIDARCQYRKEAQQEFYFQFHNKQSVSFHGFCISYHKEDILTRLEP